MDNNEVIWENEPARNYDDERDAHYTVRIPSGVPGCDWTIVGGSRDMSDALIIATSYANEHPTIPVRVIRSVNW